MDYKSLCDQYKEYFPIGAAVNPRVIKSHRELLIKNYNSITAENEMKFVEVHPHEGEYTFEKADTLVEFAVNNGMKVRGHTLVWHGQTPDWVFLNNGAAASKELLLDRMKEHISTVAGRYRGKTYCWDVVNEAIEDSSSENLRKSKWLQIIGDEFISKAFQFAHEADPAARLFYNDYNECNPDKLKKIYKLVKSLKDSGTPIHGVGLQGHWNIFEPSLDDIKAAIEQYATLGLEIQITELDVSLFRFEDRRTDLVVPEEDMLEKQAKLYGEVFKLFREYKDVITGVTFWGAADDETWLDHFPAERKNWPLVFDVNHLPKKAFRDITGF